MTAVADRPTDTAPPPQPGPVRMRTRAVWTVIKNRPPRRRWELIATWVLCAVSGVAVWTVFYAVVMTSLQEGHAQHQVYAQFREQLAQQTAPLGGMITPGAPVGLMSSPSMGLKDVVIVEGTAAGDLARGPGHRRDSPLPGQAGISVMYGRAALFGGPFDRITHAQPGDKLAVVTGQGRFVFEVRDVRHVGDPYPAPLAPDSGGMTLVTAEGGSIGNLWRPDRPVYVDLALVGKPAPAPGGNPGAVPKSELAMSGDQGTLFELVLWIPLLIAASVATVYAVARWGRWQAWLIGAPLVLGALWGVSETAVQLLPNLM